MIWGLSAWPLRDFDSSLRQSVSTCSEWRLGDPPGAGDNWGCKSSKNEIDQGSNDHDYDDDEESSNAHNDEKSRDIDEDDLEEKKEN